MTQLIGILNITPDSFSDGGKFNSTEGALTQAQALFARGASIVDVGAESTKPGAQAVNPDEEWGRMAAFWRAVNDAEGLEIENFSLDTRNPATAEKFLQMGGKIINDVSGFQNRAMVELAAQFGATCIVNHFPGATPEEVHTQNINDIAEVKTDLLFAAEVLVTAGVNREQIILDPGIGFGKTPELNIMLLNFAAIVPDWPVLIGHSKKRFLGDDRFEKEPNVKAAQTAMAAGAAFLRVHDPTWYQA